ncbi:MAG: hypothetical protein ACRYHA_11285 [Janthinobacterium lividum]
MTTLAKFFSHEDGAVARGIATLRQQCRLALRQHLALCQVVADAAASNAKR